MRRSRPAGILFSNLHTVMSTSIVLLSAGLKASLELTVEDAAAETSSGVTASVSWLTGGALFVTVGGTLALRMTHRGWRSELGVYNPADGTAVNTTTATASTVVAPEPLLVVDDSGSSGGASSVPAIAGVVSPTALSPLLTGAQVEVVALAPLSHPVRRSIGQFGLRAHCCRRVTGNQVLRRRWLWLLRACVCLLMLAWTALVAHGPAVTPVAFVAGQTLLVASLHGLDYPDNVNYDDK